MSDLNLGRELGGYHLLERIGVGSMAEVYKATQPSMGRTVAIKVLSSALSGDPEFVARFRQEARIVAALEHPHILPVIDFGEEKDTLYLVMRYVSGGTLHDLIRKGPLNRTQVMRYLTQIGGALDYAHEQGVVHRDIKPKNVLLDRQGNPFLTDFGLAKFAAEQGITVSGVGLIGTPHYMSPEQGRGQPVDRRSDVYSLGVVLFEMLTGRIPFDADSAVGIVMKHISDPVPTLTDLNHDLPAGLNGVIQRALAKAPADRYASAHDLVEAAARAYAGLPALADTPAPVLAPVNLHIPTPPNRSPSISTPLRGWMAVFTLVAMMMGVGWWASINLAPVPPTRTATTSGVVELTTTPTRTPAIAATLASPTPRSTTPAPSPVAASATAPFASPEEIIWLQDAARLVPVPAGEFWLGALDKDTAAAENEKPAIALTLDGFWIDKTEITVAQFATFVQATGYRTDAESGCCGGRFASAGGIVFTGNSEGFVGGANWRLPNGPGAPSAETQPRAAVVQVSWNDAQAYCQWVGRRLPTEEEWDKAARGPDGQIYPWGDAFDPASDKTARTNFCDRNCGADWRDTTFNDGATRGAVAVGVYAPGGSPFGALEMSGNVQEWVDGLYSPLGYFAYLLPQPTTTPTTDTVRAVRGGSWVDTANRVRAGARTGLTPDARTNYTGFRCAVSVLPPTGIAVPTNTPISPIPTSTPTLTSP